MSKQGRYCILCYVEEDVSICRKCLVPWQAAYDSNNAFSQVLKYARAEDEPHMLCLYCVAEDFGNEEELTLPANALDDTARLQLTKICKAVDTVARLIKTGVVDAGMQNMTARSLRGASPSKIYQLFPDLLQPALDLGRWTTAKTFLDS